MVRILKTLGIILLVLYALGCVILYFSQDALIFDPSPLPETHVFRTGSEVEVPVGEDISLNCLLMKGGAQGVILYLHGNRGNLRRCIRQAETFAGLGYDIFMPDYRGFGKTEGAIRSEGQLFRDVTKVYEYLRTQYDESRIVIVGYSLGTGMSSYLASKFDPKSLVLLAPYVSFIDLKNRIFPLVPNFLIKYPLRNHAHLKNVACPVTLVHGTDDEIIPFESSLQLSKIAPDQINLVKLPGVGHRSTIFRSEVREAVLRAIRS